MDEDKERIKNTVALERTESEGDGNGKKGGQALPPFLTLGQLGGMTTSKELPNALNYLVNPGDNPRQMTMRTFIPEKRTEASRMATIYAYHLGRCRYFHDKDGEDEILDMLGLNVSINGLGRNQLTAAITGERQHEENKGGLGAWLQKTAWGNGKKDG